MGGACSSSTNTKGNNVLTKYLNITSETWSRNSYGLFDNECKKTIKKVFKVNSAGLFKRNVDDLELISAEKVSKQITSGSEKEQQKVHLNQLMNITIENGQYQFNIPENKLKQLQEEQKMLKANNVYDLCDSAEIFEQFMWQKINMNEKFKLKLGDTLKLGRIWFKIIEHSINNNRKSLHDELCNKEAIKYFEQDERKRSGQYQRHTTHIDLSMIDKDAIPDEDVMMSNEDDLDKIIIDIKPETSIPNKKDSSLRTKKNKIPKSIKPIQAFVQSRLEYLIDQDINQQEETESSNKCRMCWEVETDEDIKEGNPLISPCSCIGSVQYAHVNCLKLWMKEKINVIREKFNRVIQYNCKKSDCELCKRPYKTNYNLFEFERPKNEDYMVLEVYKGEQLSGGFKKIYVVKFQNNDSVIKIGRGSKSDVKINDISVSRSHARIFKKENNFYLQDLQSKFGSLCKVDNKFIYQNKENESREIQIGRTIFTINLLDKQQNQKQSIKDQQQIS